LIEIDAGPLRVELILLGVTHRNRGLHRKRRIYRSHRTATPTKMTRGTTMPGGSVGSTYGDRPGPWQTGGLSKWSGQERGGWIPIDGPGKS
jgi:hypothetical protein